MKTICSKTIYAILAVALMTLAFPVTGWGATYKVLKALYPLDGLEPVGGLVFDAAGNLYGTTSLGGGMNQGNQGSVFILKPAATGPWGESALHIFRADGHDGQIPKGNLIIDGQGNLYGSTILGGASSAGTIYELSPTSQGRWTETQLHAFSTSDGASPSSLLRDSAGNIYGTAFKGGAHGVGVAFELSPTGGGGYNYTILYTFGAHTGDARSPRSELIQDSAGNLFGTTKGGGQYGDGTVFELSPLIGSGWTETVLYSFNGTGGLTPMAGLTMDPAGNLYGTTESGGSFSLGNVFELSPTQGGGWTEKELYAFGTTPGDGAEPFATLTLDAAGNLYGTTSYGGGGFGGTVFEVSPVGGGQWTNTTLYSFSSGLNGSTPFAPVILDGAGNLYGTTEFGGGSNAGVVFELTP